MSELKTRVEEAQKEAVTHSITCYKLIQNEGLKVAIEYCESKGIAPPQCSLSANTCHAEKMRSIAARMLSETKWWKRRLKNKEWQEFEAEQRAKGLVTNVISKESLVYYKANKR
ncbi:hypothetical protein [Moritella sp. 28]|uniref:hypothetical protein n=1 Tax=Moritella sp. 28 TaxID=2746232 RepID=UPI001BA99DEB|nr:hypothetical protein [Moritella sp. 28]QUM85970.1 hypothetical protein HWV02_16365 [Moritella sp. 28]